MNQYIIISERKNDKTEGSAVADKPRDALCYLEMSLRIKSHERISPYKLPQ